MSEYDDDMGPFGCAFGILLIVLALVGLFHIIDFAVEYIPKIKCERIK